MFVQYLFCSDHILQVYRPHIYNVLLYRVLKIEYIYFLCSVCCINISASIAEVGAPMVNPSIRS
jgi:hypothetical protein